MTDEGAPPPDGPPPRRVVSDTAERTRRLRWERDTTEELGRVAGLVEGLARTAVPGNLVDIVAGLREAVDRLEAADRLAPNPFHWDDITDPGERARREHEMGRWWAEVVRVWHPRATAEVLPCWFEHLESRQVVQGGWLAWLGAYRVRGRKHGDPAYWIRVNLPAMVEEVEAAIGSRMEGCEVHPDSPEETNRMA